MNIEFEADVIADPGLLVQAIVATMRRTEPRAKLWGALEAQYRGDLTLTEPFKQRLVKQHVRAQGRAEARRAKRAEHQAALDALIAELREARA